MPFWKKSYQQTEARRGLSPSHRIGQTFGNGNHRPRPVEDFHRIKLRCSSRLGRHLRCDAQPYGARQSDNLEWIELLSEAKDDNSAQDEEDDQSEHPLV